MYSQNDEENCIWDLVGKTPGNFLDIGAYDGKTFSNTLKLVENGWSGFCIEPAPSVFNALFELHKNNTNVRCIMAAITEGTESKMSTFYNCGSDAIGTLNTSHVDKWSSYAKFSPFLLWTVPLGTLLDSLNEDYEFVNIDVEGNSVDLFREFSKLYKGTRLKCLCVEYDGRVDECKEIAHEMGMRAVHITGENLIFSK
jgi:FkbM family methyltransferase